MFISSAAEHIGSFSGNNSPCLGDVQPVEAYPRRASRILRHFTHLVRS